MLGHAIEGGIESSLQFMLQVNSLVVVKRLKQLLPPTRKSTLRFFCIMSTLILRNGTVILLLTGKFGLNIFQDVKSKKIKLKNYLKN
jgi:hypothetical protein